MIPGLGSSGPEHWQTRWERERADCRRAELGDWNDPAPDRWLGAIDRSVRELADAPILIAHSLGCIAVAEWASAAGARQTRVVAALLVAPPDVERDDADPRLRRFAPVHRRPMPFPTVLVASRDDPYATFARSQEMAAGWAARFHDAGAAGHLNAASGLGSWDEGQRLLADLVRDASGRRRCPAGPA
ncbi:RBBP9/YdeN family alpha/beta hydrolase [Sphingomonas bacterium]|uniref:RBBP9/YdeN family alpha/beta hydrolase n=1 Tax=Sphingomonas bacterium TaxID=1895847 RepID=UPI0015760D40|nr:alpha/beta hydrolase [Sphingomonas bacterium]